MTRTRCSWARTPLGIAYHDEEWGAPVHDDRVLFEFLSRSRVSRRHESSA
jgi:DNA-3-methyladenine glycosylase I